MYKYTIMLCCACASGYVNESAICGFAYKSDK